MKFRNKYITLAFLVIIVVNCSWSQQIRSVDICVYGATSSGVMAAYTAGKMGKSVILVEPGKHPGGLSSGGLGYTDIGNKYAITGLALDFYRRLGRHYGKFEQWIFEPHVAEELFREYLDRAKIPVLYDHRLLKLTKQENRIQSIRVGHTNRSDPADEWEIRAKEFIDCSYEGDLMAGAGVSYTVGRESNDQYHETLNGVQLRDKHQFPDGIDPYIIKGKPESGLLWGIGTDTLQANGTGDRKVQTYNFRICLTDSAANRETITRPGGYDSTRYELLIRLLEKEPGRPLDLLINPNYMPHHKTDINNNGPFSTDMIGMNYDYPDGNEEQRKKIQRLQEEYTKGLLYFIGHDPRMPAPIREEMLRWGYPKDEYPDNHHWSPQMYIRESRRMIGAYVMTQANCEGRLTVDDAIGMAAYTMDSHNTQRLVVKKNGIPMVKNEGDVQVGGFPPYPISYRSLTPKENECANLLVPVCLSASHIAYGSIRMEPVFMVMGQSGAVAAVLAINAGTSVQRVKVKDLQYILKTDPLADKSHPDILVDNTDSLNVVLLGHWNILRGSSFFGGSALLAENPNPGKAIARFSASIPASGRYKIYVFVPEWKEHADSMMVKISNGRANYQKTIAFNDGPLDEQSSGSWRELGVIDMYHQQKSYIEISASKGGGSIIADAVLWVPDRKRRPATLTN